MSDNTDRDDIQAAAQAARAAYDEQVAPQLRAVVELCHQLGMPMFAAVQYGPDSVGSMGYTPVGCDERIGLAAAVVRSTREELAAVDLIGPGAGEDESGGVQH